MTVFDQYRNLLFSIAYRILGSAADAEDAVQDSWLKWSAADRSKVADPKAYLVRIVSNTALDRLRAASARRETYLGPWLPEPILTSGEVPDVAPALLLVLENLTPLERAVFVLREAFAFSYDEIAEAVERTPESVRQTAHRAREHVRARRPRFPADRDRQRAVTERFFAAATGGDINTLMELLAPDVTLWTDGGGKVRQAMRPVHGAERVATWLAGVGSRPYEGVRPDQMSAALVELNGGAGVVFSGAGRVIATITLDLDDDGRVAAILNTANPDKLAAIRSGVVHSL
ncbi:RNA polymerase sigma factor SigJ [Actinoplanes ianthinogenes]|uniref:RNA polymerase sigma factor SigJ n=1 Tax=Actinoplanes ianthinogenes TaxID=122358 RepID=UPI001E527F34|nr:RNA polymerase sigma factor SigJ [Actinoplanes ianthinogenes]